MANDLIFIENSAISDGSDDARDTCLPAVVASLADRAKDYAAKARADSTREAYASDMRAFEAFCAERGFLALPSTTGAVLAFLIESAAVLKVSTLRRRLVAIRRAHAAAGHDLDTRSAAFLDVWGGIQREHGQPPNKKRALLTADLRRAVEVLPDTLAGRRDRALILVGFAAALRRSEIAGLEVARRDGAAWIEAQDDGLIVHLGKTKTDQRGVGADVGVPYGANPATCPVRNYRAWLKAAKLKAGPAFRAIDRHGNLGEAALTGRAIADIVKRAILALALREGASQEQAREQAAAYAGHSLRSGLATSAAANDAPGHAIQRQLRHKRFDTTSGYIRAGQIFRQNAAGMAGL